VAVPTGRELVVYAGGVTGGVHGITGQVIADNGLTKHGNRTLFLGGNNSDTLVGDITVNDGSLAFADDVALGSTLNRVVINGGNLRAQASMTLNRDLVINAGGGAFHNDGNRDIALTGILSGDGALTFAANNGNNGIVRIQGANANTFAGGMLVTNGVVEFSRNNQIGASPVAGDYDRGHIALIETAGSNTTLRLAANSGSVVAENRQFTLLGNPRIEVASSTDTLTINQDIRGSGSLTKTGAGTLVLSNSLGNGYTGPTTVSAGALLANNTAFTATGTGAVTVSSGALLGGRGIIEGAITGSAGSFLSPGAELTEGSVGNLVGQNGLTLQENATFIWSLAALSTINPGTEYDRFTLESGALNIASGANLSLDFALGVEPSANSFWSSNHVWDDIIDLTFAATPGNLGSFDINNSAWAEFGSFSAVADANGYDLVWTAVPEPGSATLLLGGLALAANLRRRQRRD
jgi:autotransporter-associated beta strand protein